MKCARCKATCRCIDSRPRLNYGADGARWAGHELLRERKYLCARCRLAVISQEYRVGGYKSKIYGKRQGAPKKCRE